MLQVPGMHWLKLLVEAFSFSSVRLDPRKYPVFLMSLFVLVVVSPDCWCGPSDKFCRILPVIQGDRGVVFKY